MQKVLLADITDLLSDTMPVGDNVATFEPIVKFRRGGAGNDNILNVHLKTLANNLSKGGKYAQVTDGPVSSKENGAFAGITCCEKGPVAGARDCMSKLLPNTVTYVYALEPNSYLSTVTKYLTTKSKDPYPGLVFYSGSIRDGVPTPEHILKDNFEFNPDYYKYDGKAYVSISYTCTPCDFIKGACAGYTANVRVYMYLFPTHLFHTRCCAQVDITSDSSLLCEKRYTGKGDACKILLNKHCAGNLSDPICGCYTDYVEDYWKDKPLIKRLREQGVTVPPGCSSTCNPSLAWVPPEGMRCELNVCTVDFENQGAIRTSGGDVSINTDCGTSRNGGSGNGSSNGSGNSGGNGGSDSSSGNGDGKGEGPKVSTTIVAIAVTSGVVLILLLLLFVYLLSRK